MILKNSKPLLIILSLISISLLAVLVLGAYRIQLKNKEASELLNLADRAAEARTLAQSIRTVQSSAAEELAAFDSFTLSDSKLVPLIESVEGVGKALGLNTDIVSVGKIEDKKAVEPAMIRIVMETQGSWAQNLSFLRAIESLPNRVVIDELGLSKAEVGWRLRMVLSLYSFN
ncbi:MAG: hypothetical protein Q7R69_01485 [bacterium]|nr:hypothetical protein [bacterium]